MKKTNEDGIDVYEDDATKIVDIRSNKDTMPTIAIEVKNGKANILCLICNYKSDDEEIFKQHTCTVKGDEKLR